MRTSARDEILEKLKAALRCQPPVRPRVPPFAEIGWTRERMVKEFRDNLVLQTAAFHRVQDYERAAVEVIRILTSEGIDRIAVSADAVVERLNLKERVEEHHIEILRLKECASREEFKRMVFDQAGAGVTGVDFAIAESGTICIAHNKEQPRLVSLAPIMHIALVPIERLYRIYEEAVEQVFGGSENIPSQFTFITGPSMTADIQGVPFKGMHGPKKLAVILIG